MAIRKAAKFKMINAVLKLSAEVLANGGLPPMHVLGPFIMSVRDELRRKAVDIPVEIAPGRKSDWIYKARFNLSLTDITILRERLEGNKRETQDFKVSRHVYMRSLLRPQTFYQFSAITGTLWCWVAECKSFAGAEKKSADDAANNSQHPSRKRRGRGRSS